MKLKAIILFDSKSADVREYKKDIEAGLNDPYFPASIKSIKWVEVPKCPYSSIRAAYNEAFKGYAVTQISEKGLKSGSQRAKKLKARWEDYNTLEWWIEYFDFCTESPFLMGKIPPRDGFRQFRLDIDYLINEAKLNLIMEGKYHG